MVATAFPRAFAFLFLAGARVVSRSRLTAVEHEVLWAMMARLERGACASARQSEIAAEIRRTRQQVSKAVRSLTEKGLLAAVGDRRWGLSREVVWRGSAKGWHRARTEARFPSAIAADDKAGLAVRPRA